MNARNPKFIISKSLDGGCVVQMNKDMALNLVDVLSEIELAQSEGHIFAFQKKLEYMANKKFFKKFNSPEQDDNGQEY